MLRFLTNLEVKKLYDTILVQREAEETRSICHRGGLDIPKNSTASVGIRLPQDVLRAPKLAVMLNEAKHFFQKLSKLSKQSKAS